MSTPAVDNSTGAPGDCERNQQLISAYLDGELDLSSALGLEHHLEECAACARTLAAQRELGQAIAAADLRYRPSPAQTERLRRAWRGAANQPVASRRPHSWMLAAAALLAVAISSWSLGRWLPGRQAEEGLAGEVVASHVRSLLAGHPEDVAASDRHTVKPWFSGRLDYSPAVVDLAAGGFSLRGGRLDYVGHRPVAALVYQGGRHVINLFTWPASYQSSSRSDRQAGRSGPEPEAISVQGFRVLHWTAGGMTWWAVSDMAEANLRQFARLIEEELARQGAS